MLHHNYFKYAFVITADKTTTPFDPQSDPEVNNKPHNAQTNSRIW